MDSLIDNGVREFKPWIRLSFGLIIVLCLIVMVGLQIGYFTSLKRREDMEAEDAQSAYVGMPLGYSPTQPLAGGPSLRSAGSIQTATNMDRGRILNHVTYDQNINNQEKQMQRDVKIQKAMAETIVGEREAPSAYLGFDADTFKKLMYGDDVYKRETAGYLAASKATRAKGLEQFSTVSQHLAAKAVGY